MNVAGRGPVTGERWLLPLLILLPLGLYARTATFGFVDFDDIQYIVANPHVSTGLSAANVSWAFESMYASNWHPLTWIAHMLDVALFGLRPAGHHAVSVLLHAANTALVFLVFSSMTGARWPSAFVAGLFAVHPLHVESVAYLAERKDVLSAFFWMTTIAAYVAYVRRGGALRYMLVVASFAAGLMAKPMVVTLPVILLILDYWPLRRLESSGGETFRRLLVEKLPLLALSCASALVTLVAQLSRDGVTTVASPSLSDDLAVALLAYTGYLRQMVWPVGLAAFYPRPETLSWAALGASAAILIGITAFAVRSRSRHPYLLAGWLWYVVTLLPVSGIVRVGSQSMADRYTYLPLLGVFVMIAWGASSLTSTPGPARTRTTAAVSAILLALSVATWRQVGYWRNGVTLFEHAVAVTAANPLARHNLGVALVNEGRNEEAVTELEAALRLDPRYGRAYVNLGHAFLNMGNASKAIESYQHALTIDPDDPDARQWLTTALTRAHPQ